MSHSLSASATAAWAPDNGDSSSPASASSTARSARRCCTATSALLSPGEDLSLLPSSVVAGFCGDL
eukprot:scaffold114566_cov63-Phaeocystis_antarctica.AAC.3